jgi:tetratricopeptide (TPR) repeat protein
VISQAADAGFGAHAWQLPWAAAMFFDWQGYWHEMAATQESALAAARGLGDRAGQFQAARFLGRAQMLLGAHAEAGANLAEALELGRELGSSILQARVHVDLAVAFERQGRRRDGLGHAEQALRLFRAAGHRWGEALAINEAGWIHAQLGACQQALAYCGQALALHRELGNQAGEGITLGCLGYAHHLLGQYGEASPATSRPSMSSVTTTICNSGLKPWPVSRTPGTRPERTPPPAVPCSRHCPSSMT